MRSTKRKISNYRRKNYKKSKSKRKSKRLVVKNQAGSGKSKRKKRNIGPKPLGASK